MTPYPCSEIVYRALRRSWLDPDTNEVKADAFIRRSRSNGGDDDGLSVNPASTCSSTQAAASLNRCAGLVSLHVGHLRDLGLDIVPDPSDPQHALITGLPYAEDDAEKAEQLAGALVRLCRPVA